MLRFLTNFLINWEFKYYAKRSKVKNFSIFLKIWVSKGVIWATECSLAPQLWGGGARGVTDFAFWNCTWNTAIDPIGRSRGRTQCVTSPPPPKGPSFFHFDTQIFRNVAVSGVNPPPFPKDFVMLWAALAPPPYEVGAPFYEKILGPPLDPNALVSCATRRDWSVVIHDCLFLL